MTKLTILIPAYNEAQTLGQIIEGVLNVPLPMQREVIVIDDGSGDETQKIAQSFKGPEVTFLRHGLNRGKGAAIRTGLARASGDIVLVQDADMEYYPSEIPRLLAPFIDPEVQAVYGSRILKAGNPKFNLRFYWGGRLISWWTNRLYGSKLTDEPTGYKAFRAGLLQSLDLSADGFEFCAEATAKMLKRRIRIVEVPISYRPRGFHEGKKLSVWDGLTALWTLTKHRLF
ncbi:MAG: hypothetical protein A3G41_02205 [Elusimicrobia bacterium RIFCSPLOWO2_12_FULL_59_9]|nr:MAG: hypothetical protein A3G41_02205 [Elusimicrobia bacterium RIFCSPLOWO2_12_FULL_59_9]